ncbi:LCP family protein [Lysinibacillus sp. SGAir0095]|uniref:LCP family glycopolymer transferase n=1 Tax=Lysinibacillus sp. SGAir0095 TaxID=2070463 RepID=UPI001F0D7E11|nr:LCP family protein [Lysinibacillus sp. SGAir0095]
MDVESEKTEKKKLSNKSKIFIGIGIGLLTLLIAIVGILAKVYADTKDTVEKVYEEIEQSELRVEVVKVEEKEPISVLILGVDERADDVGRSDTMIVLTINPNTNNTKMLSIPRDTRTEIVGYNTTDKINHAYAFGGIEMSRKTVENLLAIPIDYVVQVNMDSFKNIVDIIGGIKIENELEFTNNGYHFPLGEISLNGEEALVYVRMRYDDPDGDFGRQNRQKKVIQSIVKSAVSVEVALNYHAIFDTLGKNVKMNVSFDELTTIQKGYQDSVKNIEQLYMNSGQDQMIDDIYYYLPDEEEMENLRATLKAHLGME